MDTHISYLRCVYSHFIRVARLRPTLYFLDANETQQQKRNVRLFPSHMPNVRAHKARIYVPR